jgi:hypothetical protein
MTSSEILLLASERYSAEEISAACGISLPRAEMARADALVTLQRAAARERYLAYHRDWQRANRKSRASG